MGLTKHADYDQITAIAIRLINGEKTGADKAKHEAAINAHFFRASAIYLMWSETVQSLDGYSHGQDKLIRNLAQSVGRKSDGAA